MKKSNYFIPLIMLLISSCSVQVDSSKAEPSVASGSMEHETESSSFIEESSSVIEDSSLETSSDVIDENIDKNNIVNYLDSSGDIYKININTVDNVFPYDKETYIAGDLEIQEQNGTQYMSKQSMGIRLRGNSTLTADKKAFKIKFDKKTSLFGLQKAKKWVLLANYYDKSNIRNYLAYLMANKMDYLKYQPSCIFVDVYFNNEYQGLYLLTEQIEANEGRVDIKEHVRNNTSSFLLEIDARAPSEGVEDIDYISTDDYYFAISYPEVEERRENDVAYLKNFINQVTTAIKNKSNYEDLIDVDSFIDNYFIQEWFKNVDFGHSSEYMYIDQEDEKLHMGPVWDFDISLRVISGDNEPAYIYYDSSDIFSRNNDAFLRRLFRDEAFENKAKARYSELRFTVFEEMFNELDLVKDKLAKAQERNLKKWGLKYSSVVTTWIENAYEEDYKALTSLEEHYTYLENELKTRLDLLDNWYL